MAESVGFWGKNFDQTRREGKKLEEDQEKEEGKKKYSKF